MFEIFAKNYTRTALNPADHPTNIEQLPPSLHELLDLYGGASFDEGLYRVHNADSALMASENASFAFPALKMPLVCFGFDWLGRQFALDLRRGTPDDPGVVLLEPGTGEALEVPVTYSGFHDDALIRFRDACLVPETFDAWLRTGSAPTFSQCVGYKKPLFLGGDDLISNFELSDIDVYWSLMGQLLVATRNLPAGTPVSSLGLTF